jgi:hypothetical protein
MSNHSTTQKPNKPREFWIEKNPISKHVHIAQDVEPVFGNSIQDKIAKSNILKAIELTDEVRKALDLAESVKKGEVILNNWCLDDVISRDKKLDKTKARKVLAHIKKYHDAKVGINWEVIDQAIESLKSEGDI